VNEKSLKKLVLANFKAILFLCLLLIILPILISNSGKIVKFFSSAAPVTASIVIDSSQSQGGMLRSWEALSQGGELDKDNKIMNLGSASAPVKGLKLRYIRLDHVLEYPSDARIKEVINLGATPFISLSYFPKGVGTSDVGNIISWDGWQRAVTAMVEKVSGKDALNQSDVYYEVWNEPDGETFGHYQIGQGKDYFTLYQKTVEAIGRAKNVNPYKIGGPALADLRRCTNGLLFTCQEFWLDKFLGLVSENNIRLDFISWHRYSKKMSDYNEDVNFINELYYRHANLPPAEKVITEWGSDPGRNPIHNTVFDAAHLVAAARTFLGQVTLTTKFEVRDGPSDSKGGWGILTYGGGKKPTFAALQYLSLLRSERVPISGEGTFVTGIATKDLFGMTVILSNYDASYRNTENIPVKITNLRPGTYFVTKYVLNDNFPMGKSDPPKKLQIPDGSFQTEEVMFPNSIVMWDFQLIKA